MGFGTNFWSFIVAILILVSIHEWGHYWVAKRCGVHIERFSIGFGKPLFSWTNEVGTVFCIAMIPLGGFVKMRGEYAITTEKEVIEQPSGSFAACNVWQRMAIVVAGPLVNLLFALVVFVVLSFGAHKVVAPQAQMPLDHTLSATLGLKTGDTIMSINGVSVRNWGEVNAGLAHALFDQTAVDLTWSDAEGASHHAVLDTIGMSLDDPSSMAKIGLKPQDAPPKFGTILPNSVAEKAGFREGDLITHLNGQMVSSATELVDGIHKSPEKYVAITVSRDSKPMVIDVKPALVEQKITVNGTDTIAKEGRIGAGIEGYKWISERRGFFEAVRLGAKTTWDSTVMTFQGMYKIATGQLSLKNIGGPVSMAKMTGESTAAGMGGFIAVLAMLSVSLGALNLLPIPMLDGGHLVYYVLEVLTGKPVSENVLAIGQRIGLAFMFCLMAVAFYNDVFKMLG